MAKLRDYCRRRMGRLYESDTVDDCSETMILRHDKIYTHNAMTI